MEFDNYYLIGKVDSYNNKTTIGTALNANNPISFINPKNLKLKKGDLIGMHLLKAHYPAICDQKIRFFRTKANFQKFFTKDVSHVGSTPNHKHGILSIKKDHIEIKVTDEILDSRVKKIQSGDITNYDQIRKLGEGAKVHCQLEHKILGKVVWVTKHNH